MSTPTFMLPEYTLSKARATAHLVQLVTDFLPSSISFSVTSTLIFIFTPFSVLDSLFRRELVFGQGNHTRPECQNHQVFVQRKSRFILVTFITRGHRSLPAFTFRENMILSQRIRIRFLAAFERHGPSCSPAIKTERIGMTKLPAITQDDHYFPPSSS